MNLLLLAPAVFIVSGLVGRFKGGWLKTGGDTIPRSAWALLLAGITAVVDWKRGLASIPLNFAAGLIKHDSWQDIGSPEGAVTAEKLALSTLFGVGQALLMLLPLAFMADWMLLKFALVGFLQPIFYLIGRKLPATGLFGVIDWHTAWGEFLWTATLGTLLFVLGIF